jgi:hypothetical protein
MYGSYPRATEFMQLSVRTGGSLYLLLIPVNARRQVFSYFIMYSLILAQQSHCLGIIMSLHLFTVPGGQSQPSSSSECTDELRLLCAYENGGVMLRRYTRPDKLKSVEGAGWEVFWAVKLHVESSMSLHLTNYFAADQD